MARRESAKLLTTVRIRSHASHKVVIAAGVIFLPYIEYSISLICLLTALNKLYNILAV